jgi:hypothetical protein
MHLNLLKYSLKPPSGKKIYMVSFQVFEHCAESSLLENHGSWGIAGAPVGETIYICI